MTTPGQAAARSAQLAARSAQRSGQLYAQSASPPEAADLAYLEAFEEAPAERAAREAWIADQDRIRNEWCDSGPRLQDDPAGWQAHRDALVRCAGGDWGDVTVEGMQAALADILAEAAAPDASGVGGNHHGPTPGHDGPVPASEVPEAPAAIRPAPARAPTAKVEAPVWSATVADICSPDAERGLIEAALARGDCLAGDDVHDVTARHFGVPAHAEMFAAVRAAWVAGTPTDARSIIHSLRESGRLETVGGPEAVHGYYTAASPASAPHYAGIIRRMAALRDIETGCMAAARAARLPDADPVAILREQLADVADAVGGHVPEKTEHDNPADLCNSTLKMGKKRALVDAVLSATAASSLFGQDLEEGRLVAEPGSAAPESVTGLARLRAPRSARDVVEVSVEAGHVEPSGVVNVANVDWRMVKVPFGRNQGRTLAELNEEEVAFYVSRMRRRGAAGTLAEGEAALSAGLLAHERWAARGRSPARD